jgi:hypothetical protein
MGGRSFEKAAPTLWNALPSELQNIQSLTKFKSSLKTHLFSLAFT